MAEAISSNVKFTEETHQTQMILSKKKLSNAKLIIAVSFIAVALFTIVILMVNQDDDVGYYTVPT